MAKIVGIADTNFTPKDSDKPIEGKTLYTTETMDPRRGQGETTDHFFLTTAKLATLDFVPAPGQMVEVFYNRYGKVATLKLVGDDNIIIA